MSTNIQTLRVTGAPVSYSLISFLERKASPRSGPPLKISKYTQLNDSTVTIDVNVPARFLHLNGFTFGQHVLSVTEEASSTLNQRQNQPSFQSNSNPRQQSTRPFSQPNSNPRPRSGPALSQTPQIPRGPAGFHDPDGIAEKFIRAFFPLYDNNREDAVKQFYDEHSQFSLSISMRGANKNGKALDWSDYIKHSRNLSRVKSPNTRAARLSKGQHAIYAEWQQLPKTIHPTFEPDQLPEWLIECKQVAKLPDLTGASPAGVNGLLIIAHGAIQDLGAKGTVSQRSFDRVFVLGPSATGGVRVVSDTVVLRPYSGPAGPQPVTASGIEAPAQSTTPIPPPIPAIPQHPEVPPGSGVGEPRPGKSDEQLIKEQKVLNLSFQTKLKLQWAEQCLSGNNWDLEAAMTNLQVLISTQKIPADAFLAAV